MRETFTKGMARNIYYGGSVFFFLVFIGLTVDTVQGLPKTDNRENLSEEVAAGKRLWEHNNCLGCHTLLGEGAYFAPELGNVYTRYGESTEAIKALSRVVPSMVFQVVAACRSSISVIRSWKKLRNS